MELNGAGADLRVSAATASAWKQAIDESGLTDGEALVAFILERFPTADPMMVARFVALFRPVVTTEAPETGIVRLARMSDLRMDVQLAMIPDDFVGWIKNFRPGNEVERWSHAHAGECFAAACGGHIRRAKHGRWFVWTGKYWREEENDDVLRDWLDHFFKIYGYAAGQENRAAGRAIYNASFLFGTATYLAAKQEMRVEVDELDADPWLLNVENGTLNMKTGELMKFDRRNMMTKMAGCPVASREEFEEAWPRTRFAKFLDEVFEGKAELIKWIQQMLGYAMTGDTTLHVMQFWSGTGRNGKSTLGELMLRIAGSYGSKVQNKLLAARGTDPHPTEIAALRGLRIAVASEVSSNEYFDVEKIKELTGDEVLQARFMRQNFFTFPRTHKFVIYGNSNPRIRTTDPAFAARLKVVKFLRNFEELGLMDTELPAKLRAEMPIILRWLADGAASISGKIEDCAVIKEWTRGYMSENDSVRQWFDDMLTVVPPEGLLRKRLKDGKELTVMPREVVVAVSGLYNSYAVYAKEHGFSVIGGQKFQLKLDEVIESVGITADVLGEQPYFDALNKGCGGFRRKWLRGLMLAANDPAAEDARSRSDNSTKVKQFSAWYYGIDSEHEMAARRNVLLFQELEF